MIFFYYWRIGYGKWRKGIEIILLLLVLSVCACDYIKTTTNNPIDIMFGSSISTKIYRDITARTHIVNTRIEWNSR